MPIQGDRQKRPMYRTEGLGIDKHDSRYRAGKRNGEQKRLAIRETGWFRLSHRHPTPLAGKLVLDAGSAATEILSTNRSGIQAAGRDFSALEQQLGQLKSVDAFFSDSAI